MVEAVPPQTSTAVAPPARAALEARVRANQVPANLGRRISSIVTGVATLGFGAVTAGMSALLIATGGKSEPLMVLAGALFILLLAAMTAGFGFLTWRWARGLPPSRAYAVTNSEHDALSD